MSKKLIPLLIFLTACNVGNKHVEETSNIDLHCENYGDITTTIEAPQDEYNDTTEPEGTSEIENIESTSEADSRVIQEDTGIGLVPGLKQSRVSWSDAERCFEQRTCNVLSDDNEKVLVEHCANLEFGAE